MLYKIKNAKLINLIFIFDLLLSAIIAVGTLFYCSLDIYIINILSISIILIIFRVLNAWVPALIIILLLYIMQLGEFFYSGNLIDSYFWDTIFSTNIEESLSFIGTLRKEQIMILLSGLFLIIPIIIINKLICKRQSRYAVFFIIVSIVLILMMLIKSHYHSENLVKKSVIINSLNTYIESRKKVNILIIIGESATRDRMSIFGYKRKTTPYAEEDKSTIIYKNNTTNGINTQPNVRTLLTGDVPSDKKEINQNLFQVTRMANFHTYVVDNNTFKSKDPLYIIKSQSDLYINMNGVGQDSHGNTKKIKFDEFALKKIEQLINSKKQGNNIYLLHLMGSHPLQNDKYPEEFNKFRSYYDNSILYSDYIIHKSKNTLFLANEKKSAIVIYIADHGVGLPHLPNGEVADNEFKSFGANDRNITNFHPPLLIWVNNTFIKNNYKEYKNLIKNTTSPINQRFLLYSISQLIGVESINKIQTKNFSIFSEESNFEPLLYTNEKKQMK